MASATGTLEALWANFCTDRASARSMQNQELSGYAEAGDRLNIGLFA
jgi:hypothetical protein